MARSRYWPDATTAALAAALALAPAVSHAAPRSARPPVAAADRTPAPAAPALPASRFGRPVAPNEARVLKTEEDTALAVAEAAAHDMDLLAHSVPERRLARQETSALHAIRPLVQRRQQLRQTFIRLGARPGTPVGGISIKTAAGATPGGGSAAGSAAGDGQGALMAATRQMQETQMSFNLQYLQLQSAMQAQSREASAISDIIKTKHDTVKKSIGSIR